jgi:hypothetical protein
MPNLAEDLTDIKLRIEEIAESHPDAGVQELAKIVGQLCRILHRVQCETQRIKRRDDLT